MKVGKLTTAQKNFLIGKEFTEYNFFNPIQDADGNWVITPEEMNGRVTNPDFLWVRDLPLITFKPIQS
jgi:hypothetical protein